MNRIVGTLLVAIFFCFAYLIKKKIARKQGKASNLSIASELKLLLIPMIKIGLILGLVSLLIVALLVAIG